MYPEIRRNSAFDLTAARLIIPPIPGYIIITKRLISGDILPADVLDDYGSAMFTIARTYRAARTLQVISARKRSASVPYQ